MRGVQLHPTAIAPANNVTKSFLKLDPVSGPAASHLMTGLPVSLLRKRTRKIAFSIQGRPDTFDYRSRPPALRKGPITKHGTVAIERQNEGCQVSLR